MEVWDSELNDGGWNAAFDQDWLALHADGERPDLLRFHRSRPTASIGRHQALGREIRLDYCCQRSIETVRRISGGGALYLDENQRGISLIFRRPSDWAGLGLAQILARFCAALAGGLTHLGIQARFKAPNDLEIDGRKLASSFVAIQGNSLLLHATLLCDADIKTMLEALRVPTEKLTVIGLESARQRLVTLREVLGEVPPDTVLQQALRQGLGTLNAGWVDARKPYDIDENQVSPAFNPTHIDWSDDNTALEALHKTPGGVLRVRFWPDAEEKTVARLQFAGDLNLHPADVLERLQRALTGLALAQAEPAVRAFFAENCCDLVGFTVDDICHLLQLVLNKLDQQLEMGLSTAQANSLMVLAHGIKSDAPSILAQAAVMLLPYCAKPAWCKWRHQDDCVECGKCAVGDAYRLARERNMQVTTITNYEHLTATLSEMKSNGVEAYVGACCSQFFIKRHQAFREAGMAAVLMDISGANCYELKQEETAYAGRFEAEARLDADALERVMNLVPPRPQSMAPAALTDGKPENASSPLSNLKERMKRIDKTLLTTLSTQAAASPRLRAHHNLHPQLDDKVQRLCIAMEPGTYVRPHRHMQPETWEILLILSGAVALLIFDDSGRVLERIELAAGGDVTAVEIPANTWHAVASLKAGTVVFEVKQGPYAPIAEANYATWSPADGGQAESLEGWYHRAQAGDTVPKY